MNKTCRKSFSLSHLHLEKKNDKREVHDLQQEVMHLKLQIRELKWSLKIEQDLKNSR